MAEDANDLDYTISPRLIHAAALPPETLLACFNLVAETSSQLYRTSRAEGWSPRAKKAEMRQRKMRYLLVLSASSSSEDDSEGGANGVLGFLSCMRTREPLPEGGKAHTLYVYEVHLTERLRGQGVGRQLMRRVEEAAREEACAFVMLTVFTANDAARRFYEEKCGFMLWDEEVVAEREERKAAGRRRLGLRSGRKRANGEAEENIEEVDEKPGYVILAKELG